MQVMEGRRKRNDDEMEKKNEDDEMEKKNEDDDNEASFWRARYSVPLPISIHKVIKLLLPPPPSSSSSSSPSASFSMGLTGDLVWGMDPRIEGVERLPSNTNHQVIPSSSFPLLIMLVYHNN